MDRRPPNLWFFASWVLLVVVVVYGFFLHTRLIDKLEVEADRLNVAIVQQHQGFVELCGLMLDNFPEEFDERIVHAFGLIGVECGPAEQGP